MAGKATSTESFEINSYVYLKRTESKKSNPESTTISNIM